MGSIHLKTSKKRSKGTTRQESNAGWTAAQGTCAPMTGGVARADAPRERRSVRFDGVMFCKGPVVRIPRSGMKGG